MKLLKLTCFLLLFSSTAHTQTLFLLENNNQLYRKDLNSGAIDLIVDMGSNFSDISFHPNGRLYGIRGNGNLYEIDTLDGGITLIHTFENHTYNSLVTAADGTFYTIGSSGELRSYHLETEEEVLISIIDAQAGGDLTFIGGQLYLGDLGARIVLIDLETPSNSQIVFDLDIVGKMIGLSSTIINCDSVVTYAAISGLSSGLSELYRVNLEEGLVELACLLPFKADGSAFFHEYLGSNDSLLSVTLDSVVYDLPLCTEPVADVQFSTSHGIGDLLFSLNDTLMSNNGFFSGLDTGNYTLSIRDEIGCEWQEEIIIECEEVTSIIPLTIKDEVLIYPNPSQGKVKIQAPYKIAPLDVRVYTPTFTPVSFSIQPTYDGLQLDLSGVNPGLYYIQLNHYLHRVIITK